MAIANITNNILTDSGVAISSLVSGSGTTNYISKFTASGVLGNSLIWDNGTNVGIGNTSPAYKLDVNGTGNFTGALTGISATFERCAFVLPPILAPFAPANGIYLSNSNQLTLTTNSGQRLTIDYQGNVGIATMSPAYTLDVTGTGRFTDALTASAFIPSGATVPTNGMYLSAANTLNFSTNTTNRLSISSLGTVTAIANFISSTVTDTPSTGTTVAGNATYNYLGSSGYWGIRTTATGFNFALDTYNGGTPKNVLTITQAGLVGIGMTPDVPLQVKAASGTFTAVRIGSTASGFELSQENAGYTVCIVKNIYGTTSASAELALQSGFLTFYSGTSFAERMRITSGGKLLVGKTTASGNLGSTPNVEAAGTFYSSASQAGYFWEDRTNGAYWYGWYATGASTVYFYNGNSGTNIASINPTTGVYTPITPSDSRLKDNIINYNRGLSELLKLEVKEWEYNGKAKTNKGEKTIGFVADQIINVIPEWVSEYDVKLEESDEEKTQVKRIITNDLQYLLVKAIQEQQAQIEELSNRLIKVENK